MNIYVYIHVYDKKKLVIFITLLVITISRV